MDEIENLGTTLTEVAAVSQTNKLLFEMHRLAHKLAGRGGTFGYPDVSKRGAALEAAVAEIRAAEGNFPAANLRRMYDLIAGLRTAIDALP